jgi:hypothetical protein
MDMADDLLGSVATRARIEEPSESPLIVGILVYVGNAKLRLPQESVVRTFENLALFGDGVDNGFKRRTTIGNPKRTPLDLAHDLGYPAPD